MKPDSIVGLWSLVGAGSGLAALAPVAALVLGRPFLVRVVRIGGSRVRLAGTPGSGGILFIHVFLTVPGRHTLTSVQVSQGNAHAGIQEPNL